MSDYLVKNRFYDPIDRDDSRVPVVTHQVYGFVDRFLGDKRSITINRASSAPLCPKRRWYQKRGTQGTKLTPRVIVNFTIGDLTEHTMKYFILRGCVGKGKLYSEVDFGEKTGSFTIQNGKVIPLYSQQELTAKIGRITVTAHADGWGKRNSDGKWELIEVKSASEYGYKNFLRNKDKIDYLKQAMVLLQTCRAKELRAKHVRFIFLKKNTGHIWDRAYPFDETLAELVAKEFRIANQAKEPKAPYSPQPEVKSGIETGRMVLRYPCTYCPYSRVCQPEFEIKYVSGKPVHVIKENWHG